jgi:transcriptional/translational regulatory protein YebC/TACO1
MSSADVYGYHTRLFSLPAPKLSHPRKIQCRCSKRLMAGHSKWVSILHRRSLWDGKLGRAATAVGEGYESVRYEGYGPGDTAVLVDCLTDNRERSGAQVRRALREHGGALGAEGSVSYLFNPVGLMIYPPGTHQERLTRAALEAGAEEVVSKGDRSIEILVDPIEFDTVQAQLTSKGFVPATALVTERASTSVLLTGEAAVSMMHLLESLLDLNDTQNVYTNAEIPDEVLARF